ncbi:hypothetical protein U0070_025665, partial [Myodes glareolus]
MPLLTHQTQTDMKACTLEKNLANLKTIKDSKLQRKNTGRENMMTIWALHIVLYSKQSLTCVGTTPVWEVYQYHLKSRCTAADKCYCKETLQVSHYRHHSVEKPYKCNECDRSFPHDLSLRRHQKNHILEKLHKCKER